PTEPQRIVRLPKCNSISPARLRDVSLQGTATQLRWCLNGEEIQNRRQDIRSANLRFHDLGLVCLGKFYDQGHMCCRVVQKYAMGFFAMLAKTLAVFANDDDDRVLIQSFLFQIRNEIGDDRVCVCNLSVIRSVLVGLPKGIRRLVRIVWVIQMYPNEVRTCTVCAEPLFRMLHNFTAPSLNAPPTGFRRGISGEVVVE